MYTSIRLIAATRTVRKRRDAMRRQAQRRRECLTYGAPVHAEPESEKQIAAFVRAEMNRTYGRKR